MGEALLELIGRILVDVVIEGVVHPVLRGLGALVRWPFHRGKRYKQVLGLSGNSWIGVPVLIGLIVVLVAAC